MQVFRASLLFASALIALFIGLLPSTVSEEIRTTGRVEDQRCICTFIPPYIAADSPRSNSVQCPAGNSEDVPFLKREIEFLQEHHIANRKQLNFQTERLQNVSVHIWRLEERYRERLGQQRTWEVRLLSLIEENKQLRGAVFQQDESLKLVTSRLESMTRELTYLRDLNWRIQFRVQEESLKNKMYRQSVEEIRKRLFAAEGDVGEFLWALTRVLATMPVSARKKLHEMVALAQATPTEEPPEMAGKPNAAWEPIPTDASEERAEFVATPKPRRRSVKKMLGT
ncbi:Hypp3695 [Branchiostoma lanceolatum]|uniref:Hypp3695 protein n=1 Tax=Branchiostoma lanceolatum TaxID=7740 RepID=A0A8K0A0U0_BRALA|nr:Hypp3695 [Branchiostoma lanceolatum]